MNKTASAVKKHLPNHNGGTWVHFTHRDTMRRKKPMAKAVLPTAEKAVPPTTLPVDCTGNATVSCPMDGNDTLGICGGAMAAHKNTIRSYGQGKPGFTAVLANVAALEAQYEAKSGGDNGLDEDMVVGPGGIWMVGIAGDATQVVVDHLDVDITNIPLMQYLHDQFYGVEMAWSVPDAFLQGFAQGTVWSGAMPPNPANGHFVTMSDVSGQATLDAININGFQRMWTWGAWCWVGPEFVASVDPECFVTFSPVQFSKATGYDSHGRHVSDQAAAWVAIGGNAAIVAATVAQFPPKATVAPTPAPAGTVVTLAQAIAWAESGLGGLFMTSAMAKNDVVKALTANWPKP